MNCQKNQDVLNKVQTQSVENELERTIKSSFWGQTMSFNEQAASYPLQFPQYLLPTLCSVYYQHYRNQSDPKQIHLNDSVPTKKNDLAPISEQNMAQKWSLDVNNYHHYCHLNIQIIFWCIQHKTSIAQGPLVFIQGFFNLLLVLFVCKSTEKDL